MAAIIFRLSFNNQEISFEIRSHAHTQEKNSENNNKYCLPIVKSIDICFYDSAIKNHQLRIAAPTVASTVDCQSHRLIETRSKDTNIFEYWSRFATVRAFIRIYRLTCSFERMRNIRGCRPAENPSHERKKKKAIKFIVSKFSILYYYRALSRNTKNLNKYRKICIHVSRYLLARCQSLVLLSALPFRCVRPQRDCGANECLREREK